MLAVAGVGYPVRRRLRRQAEGDLIIRLMRHVRIDVDLNGAVQTFAHDLMRVLSARRILVAAQETDGGRALLWSVDRATERSRASIHVGEMSSVERPIYFFPAPLPWCAVRHDRLDEEDPFEVFVGDRPSDAVLDESRTLVPEPFAALHLSRSCLAVSFAFGSEWTCRLFVLDAKLGEHPRNTLRFLRRLVDELSPAAYNVYQFHRLQSGAVAMERASLARALHDDLIQSLISAEMRLHAVRKFLTDEAAATELHRIEETLHEEVLGVRDLMQRIKPLHLEATELLGFLADHVQKFASDTGIKASFFANVRHVALPARMCTVVARIVRESLSNVRKHSGARNVVVRLTETGNRWLLIVEDNGRGLGSLSASAQPTERMSTKNAFGDVRLDLSQPRSPSVIMDCVRSLDGELDLRSAAGGGLRLEIRFAGPASGQLVPAKSPKTVRAAASASPARHEDATYVSAFVGRPATRRFLRWFGQEGGLL